MRSRAAGLARSVPFPPGLLPSKLQRRDNAIETAERIGTQRIQKQVITRGADESDVLVELTACHECPSRRVEYFNRRVQEAIHVHVWIQPDLGPSGCLLTGER